MEEKQYIIYVRSLGCAKNLVDTEVMCGELSVRGYYLTNELNLANVYLVNTCGFIRDAKTESRDAIKEALRWKRKRHGRLVLVAGCLVQRELETLKADFPGVDQFLGLDDVPKIVEALEGCERQAMEPNVSLPNYLYDEKTPRLQLTAPTFAYVKVAEGCDHRCSYCAIPGIRGKQRSRTIASVVEECRNLLKLGVKELDLIAQDTSRYGADLEPKATLEELLRACDELEGDFWIRVLYTHPLHLTEGLIDILAHGKHVVPYLDIPLQHISDNILLSMKRGMDGAKTRALLDKIRSEHPEMTVRTTFLVGYPGETEENFQELMGFVKEFGFDRMGAFAFSCEAGTAAAEITEGLVPERVGVQRQAELMKEQRGISLARNKAKVGQTMRVLLEEPYYDNKGIQHNSIWVGRSAGDAPEVDQLVLVQCKRGRRMNNGAGFVEVRITGASEYELIGKEL